mmetsp:Transcript_17749/g.40220  ORF Transcript_17749/g.40220 Transcript_17749/m.40220 type:complete len:862 (-) Transcript_17749:418-3003(-)
MEGDAKYPMQRRAWTVKRRRAAQCGHGTAVLVLASALGYLGQKPVHGKVFRFAPIVKGTPVPKSRVLDDAGAVLDIPRAETFSERWRPILDETTEDGSHNEDDAVREHRYGIHALYTVSEIVMSALNVDRTVEPTPVSLLVHRPRLEKAKAELWSICECLPRGTAGLKESDARVSSHTILDIDHHAWRAALLVAGTAQDLLNCTISLQQAIPPSWILSRFRKQMFENDTNLLFPHDRNNVRDAGDIHLRPVDYAAPCDAVAPVALRIYALDRCIGANYEAGHCVGQPKKNSAANRAVDVFFAGYASLPKYEHRPLRIAGGVAWSHSCVLSPVCSRGNGHRGKCNAALLSSSLKFPRTLQESQARQQRMEREHREAAAAAERARKVQEQRLAARSIKKEQVKKEALERADLKQRQIQEHIRILQAAQAAAAAKAQQVGAASSSMKHFVGKAGAMPVAAKYPKALTAINGAGGVPMVRTAGIMGHKSALGNGGTISRPPLQTAKKQIISSSQGATTGAPMPSSVPASYRPHPPPSGAEPGVSSGAAVKATGAQMQMQMQRVAPLKPGMKNMTPVGSKPTNPTNSTLLYKNMAHRALPSGVGGAGGSGLAVPNPLKSRVAPPKISSTTSDLPLTPNPLLKHKIPSVPVPATDSPHLRNSPLKNPLHDNITPLGQRNLVGAPSSSVPKHPLHHYPTPNPLAQRSTTSASISQKRELASFPAHAQLKPQNTSSLRLYTKNIVPLQYSSPPNPLQTSLPAIQKKSASEALGTSAQQNPPLVLSKNVSSTSSNAFETHHLITSSALMQTSVVSGAASTLIRTPQTLNTAVTIPEYELQNENTSLPTVPILKQNDSLVLPDEDESIARI